MSLQPTTSPTPSSSFGLTAEDVKNLLENKTEGTLLDVTTKIASAYGLNALASGDNKAAEQVFRLLMRETEIRVRVALAQNLKSSDIIPKDIVMQMAKDVEEVALPVLQFSQILDDNDLLDLLENFAGTQRLIAISKRETVSNILSDTLLNKGDNSVAQTLLNNTGAHISERGFKHIVEVYATDQMMMESLAQRPQLPVSVAEKLVHVVSEKLGEAIKKKYLADAAPIAIEIDKTKESETLRLLKKTTDEESVDKLVAQLMSFGRLTPSLILSALCQGNFAFFEMSLARLSNIPVTNARKLIADRGDLGFRAIYNKSGLSEAMFPAVKVLLKVVRELDAEGEKPGMNRYSSRIVERIVGHADADMVDNLSYIIALVRKA